MEQDPLLQAYERFLLNADELAFESAISQFGGVAPAAELDCPIVHRISDVLVRGKWYRIVRHYNIEDRTSRLLIYRTDNPGEVPGVPLELSADALHQWVLDELANPIEGHTDWSSYLGQLRTQEASRHDSLSIDDIAELLKESRDLRSQPLAGCSETEIGTLESKYNVTLPKTYRRFLELMGHCASGLGNQPVELLYPRVLMHTQHVRELVDRFNHKRKKDYKYHQSILPIKRVLNRLGMSGVPQAPSLEICEFPADALVIYMDSGLPEYWAIRCNHSDDSPVYRFDHEDDLIELRLQYHSVADFLLSMLRENEEDHPKRIFIRGNRNPEQYGFSLRASCGKQLDREPIERAAGLLGREPFYVDHSGYECELIGAAIHPTSNRIAYVESRARERSWSSMVDISIRVHLRDIDGQDKSKDIRSYNPFFGCDVGFFEWIDDTAILIYTEKHDTYVCAFGSAWPPRFVEIEDRWIINGRTVGYMGYKQEAVKRLSLPDLEQHEPLTVADAAELGLLPPDPYAT